MKKISFILLYFCFYYGFSQNNNAIKLVDLLHGKKIEQTIESVKNLSLDTLKIDNQVKELKATLSKVYDEEYTQKDIQALITFYESATGKKMLAYQESMHSKVIDKIYKWEAKAQGMELPEETESIVIIDTTEEPLDIEKQTIKKETAPKELPKIKTLEDLKKLIEKDTSVIHDAQFLAKLLDLKQLINPALDIEDVLPETAIEKKN